MRTFKYIDEALDELSRDLLVRGNYVQCSSYQNKQLMGKDQQVLELVGVDIKILNPIAHMRDSLKFISQDKNELDKLESYCIQEIKDRTSGQPLNPGNSYKERQDLWNNFLDNGKFDYQYAERINETQQLDTIIKLLKQEKNSRQAVLSIWDRQIDMQPTKLRGLSRVPCSLTYQYLIRDNRLNCIYNMRSNDFFTHTSIDLIVCGGMMEYIVNQLKLTYPELQVGYLVFMVGSLHAFQWELNRVEF